MNRKEYIKSGIIESYVLGLATEAERQELEAMCRKYPEIEQAKHEFEVSLEKHLLKEALNPPEHLKQKILLSLNITNKNGYQKNDPVPIRRINVWRWVAAACIVLLAGTSYLFYGTWDKYHKLLAEKTSFENSTNPPDRDEVMAALHPIVQRPSVKWSIMAEPENTSHCMAHVYWDSLSTNTYLLLGNIPRPLSDKQFQLWAIQNNQATNLGLFDIQKEGQLVQMKNITNGKVFVITIEPKGGSATPTLNATYAKGEL